MISQIAATVARDGKASLKRQGRKSAFLRGLEYGMACGGLTGAILSLAWMLWEVYGR